VPQSPDEARRRFTRPRTAGGALPVLRESSHGNGAIALGVKH